MKLTYFGHSAFQIETNDGVTLLFDPFITGNKHAENVVKPESLNPDFILLTHAHGDHWGDTPAIAARSGATVVGNFEIAQYMEQKHGHKRVHPMNTGGAWQFEWGRVIQTYARHSSSFPDGTYGGNCNGYILHLENKCLYNTGDTCPFAEMAWVGEDHKVDVALMPIGDNYTMGPDDAVMAAKMIKPGLTIPLHFDTFPLIEVDTGRWERLMRDAGMEGKVLKPGETLGI